MPSLSRRVVAELIGTALLVAAVIGSGIMAQRLSNGNIALALLANTIATGAALVALILTFGPISGAHFNPAVSVSDAVVGGLSRRATTFYILTQCVGGLAGATIAHLMFSLPLYSLSEHARRQCTNIQ
jgi:glycerol uptake facilitator-like aquaporin